MGSRRAFDEVDPFSGNQVRGFVRRGRSHRGDLEITHVNGTECAQTIFGTPRIKHLRSGVPLEGAVRVYDKIDGTNVLLFHYLDAQQRVFVSYRTRLSPFLREQPYGDFVRLWGEIRERYAAALAELERSPLSFGLELFGSRLRILTDYDTELDARLLFGLDPGTGHFVDPAQLDHYTFPRPTRLSEAEGASLPGHLATHYAKAFARGERVEGAVAYFTHAGRTTAYKSTPSAVKARQRDYRALYEYARARLKQGDDSAEVLESLRTHAPSAPARVRAIACEDIAREIAFNGNGRDE